MKIIERPTKDNFIVKYTKVVAETSSITKQYSREQDKYIDYLEAKLNNVDLATVVDSYSEKDMDNAYDKGFKDAMIKYRKD